MRVVGNDLALAIITPSGKNMMIAISDSPELWASPEFDRYRMGDFYVVVPQLARAIGPISTAEYLNHILRNHSHPDLAAIEAKRIDPSSLPSCR
jgi:hypothetical protein